jgi:predicted NUDIX family phosphoesterase
MEFVFVAPREALFPACYPQGFQRFGSAAEAEAFLARVRELGFFVERERAERTPAWKQIIPYCVVVHDERILLMKRRAKGGEARLHGKLSIGVGGHINPVDDPSGDARTDLVLAAARREIEEELEVRGEFELALFGYLNDDSNPVGAVHLGLVFAANPSTPVHIREQDVLEGRMVTPGELRDLQSGLVRGESLETWSSILIPHLDELATVRTLAVRHHTPHFVP